MNTLIIGIAFLIIVLAILAYLKNKTSDKEENFPYQNLGPLLSPAENSFFGVLNQAIGTKTRIFAKVRVADIATPVKGLSASERQRAFNKIASKHFDFVLCDKDTSSVVCAIELDDQSHASRKRQKRDEFLKGVCQAAEIPLLQVPAKSGYVIEEIATLLSPYFAESTPLGQRESAPEVDSQNDRRICPKCSSAMVVRKAQKGAHAGKNFWACSSFPKCRHLEEIKNA